MSARGFTRAQMRERIYRKVVPSGIGLFEEGNPDHTKDPVSFVMRVNRQVFIQAVPNSLLTAWRRTAN